MRAVSSQEETVEKEGTSDADTESEVSDAELHPMFWTKLPEDEESKKMADSLSNLIYEDKNPNQLAVDFKDNGNNAYMRGKKYYDSALKYYLESIEWAEKGSVESVSNKLLRSTVFNNIAAVHLSKKNFRSTIDFASKAIDIGRPVAVQMDNNMKVILSLCKAYYRKALAHKKLGKLKFSLQTLEKGQELVQQQSKMSNIDYKTLSADEQKRLASQKRVFLNLRKQLEGLLREERLVAKKKLFKEREKIKIDRMLASFCLRRSISLGPLCFDVSKYIEEASQGYYPSFTVIKTDNDGNFPKAILDTILKLYSSEISRSLFEEIKANVFCSVNWKVLILYPEYKQTDFVQSWNEFTTFRDQLKVVLSEVPGWDERQEYRIKNIDVYFEESLVPPFDLHKSIAKQKAAFFKKDMEINWSSRLNVPVDLDCSLLELLVNKKFVVPFIPSVKVYSKQCDISKYV